MKQSGEISLAGIVKGNLARKMVADQGASQRMLPESHGIDAAAIFRQHVEHAARHGDVAEAMGSKPNHGSSQGVCFLPASKQRTVGHLQTLLGQRLVLSNHVRYVLRIDRWNRFLQRVKQRGQDRRNARNLVTSMEPLEQCKSDCCSGG